MKLQALGMTRSMLASSYSTLLKMMTMRLIGREKNFESSSPPVEAGR